MFTTSGRKPFMLLQPEWHCINPPSAEPMSIVEAKLQTRRGLAVTNEDSLIQRIIEGARNQVETDTCRAVVWQRWKMILDEWPDVFEINKCPVIAVESVKYQDFTTPTAVQITVDAATYKVSYSEPCRISPAFTKYWLAPRPELGAVEVTFTAGYLVPYTADATTNTLTFVDYAPTTGDRFRLTNSGGLLPAPLVEKRTYYIVGASGSTCQLSLTSGGSAIDIASPGTGLNFLGEVPQSLMTAMRKRVAVEFADREGSAIAADCERSYLQSLRAAQYTVL